jgi:hypothetical protein
LLLSRPLRTVRESFQLTQLKLSERLVERRGDDWNHHLHDIHLEPAHIPRRGLREAAPIVFAVGQRAFRRFVASSPYLLGIIPWGCLIGAHLSREQVHLRIETTA